MAMAKDVGLDRLLQLSTVQVHQKTTGLSGSKFLIHVDGEELFYLKEEGNFLNFIAKGSTRGFHMDGVDNQGTKVFSLRRPAVFMSDKLEVSLHGALVSKVRKEATFMTPVFHINDANDQPVLRVKGSITDHDYKTKDKTTIGTINKKYKGLLKEMFTYKDDYVITFPADLDVRYKLATIGACVLIDYRYHEG